MTSQLQAGPRDGLRGPDFALGVIEDWDRDPDGGLRVKLKGAGLWYMPSHDRLFRPTVKILELAEQRGDAIFISGQGSTGHIERVILPQRLSPLQIDPTPSGGRRTVMFIDSMSAYFLYEDRPWAKSAIAIIESALARQTPAEPVLVAIDVVTSEIVAVRK